MIRFLSLFSIVCFVGGVVLIATGDGADRTIGLAPLLIAISISIFLALRSMFHKARGLASDARAFLGGDVQQARVIEVGEPTGWFSPSSTLVLELEAEDGTKRQFEHDVPMPLPVALSYRFGKRFKFARSLDLSSMMAMELRREGLNVSVERPGSDEPDETTTATV
jgi:hypothetical protein